jgi:disulfide oxidoreductase YuzD
MPKDITNKQLAKELRSLADKIERDDFYYVAIVTKSADWQAEVLVADDGLEDLLTHHLRRMLHKMTYNKDDVNKVIH